MTEPQTETPSETGSLKSPHPYGLRYLPSNAVTLNVQVNHQIHPVGDLCAQKALSQRLRVTLTPVYRAVYGEMCNMKDDFDQIPS